MRYKQIGYIGLGKMGSRMVRRLLRKGWRVVAYNRSPAPVRRAVRQGAQPANDLADLVRQLRRPRLIWLMVSYQAVDPLLRQLLPKLARGDIIIDGGNSPYWLSVKRAQLAARRGLHYLDVGVSGGPAGALAGACLMIGGRRAVFQRYQDLFKALAVKGGYAYLGPAGAGHFVKMVHNGIEYGMMQALAEGFALMKRSDYHLSLKEIAALYNHGSVVASRLVDWLHKAFTQHGENLTRVTGRVAATGEAAWTVRLAKRQGLPLPVIKQAVLFRLQSHQKPSYTAKVLSALRQQFGGHEVSTRETTKR